MALVYLSLGSNKGDRVGFIQKASSLLNGFEGVNVIQSSSLYETEPWGVESDNWFVNAVVQAKTTLSPEALLKQCQKIETMLGRDRNKEGRYGDRNIDIDILFYDDKIISDIYDGQQLIIPHAHFHERAFTLVPMLELAPDFTHPVYKKTISTLHDELENPEMVYLYGTRVE